MTALSLAALAIAILVMFLRPAGGAWWAGPLAVAAVATATTVVRFDTARSALGALRDPLLFLAVAVPLAKALDELGVFQALAALVSGGRHLVLGLWVLAALVTAVLNLDAAVVLLTPLYLRIAALHGLSVEALAFQPALLACLASQPLPVSNLTNLIVAGHGGVSTPDFLRHLGPATVVTVTVGWFAYRRQFPTTPTAAPPPVAVDRRALAVGLPIVGFVFLGFVAGDAIGVPAWIVAAVALCAASVANRSAGAVRSVPIEAIALAAGLAVLVAAASPHLGLGRILGGDDGLVGRLRALAVGSVLSDATNNLPAVLATAPLAHGRQLWPLVFAVNAAPAFVLTGALSSLLWRDTARAGHLRVSARRFTAVGLRVAGPAFLAGAAMVVLVP